MLQRLTLPFRFDPALLKADLALIRPEEWSPHFNERDYGGIWRGVALRSRTGHASDLASTPPGPALVRDTPALARCAYFQRVLSTFQCPLKTVRLLSLAPQSFIREHSDVALGYEHGEIRIHIPVQTDPDVEFCVAGKRIELEEGGCYYINVNLRHRVTNRSAADRIHMVIDADVNEWVHTLFRVSSAAPA